MAGVKDSDVNALFSKADKDNNGYLTQDELMKVTPRDPRSPGQRMKNVQEIIINIDRSHGEKLGIKIEKHRIETINSDLVVGRWNQQNPSMSVLPGDKIVEVNGKRDWWEIAEEMKRPQVLDMKFERKVPGSPGRAGSRS